MSETREAIAPTSVERVPRSATVANRGLQTTGDVVRFCSAMVADLVNGNVSPQIGNATVRHVNAAMNAAKLRLRYGGKDPRDLLLADVQEDSKTAKIERLQKQLEELQKD